jgi:hypothetical protein
VGVEYGLGGVYPPCAFTISTFIGLGLGGEVEPGFHVLLGLGVTG